MVSVLGSGYTGCWLDFTGYWLTNLLLIDLGQRCGQELKKVVISIGVTITEATVTTPQQNMLMFTFLIKLHWIQKLIYSLLVFPHDVTN